jgi:uncharacterized protein YbjT (DUF2867 family)
MAGEKVLVVAATGKTGLNIVRALVEKGFDVYGTSRSQRGADKLKSKGATGLVANYCVKADLQRCFTESGAKLVFLVTDFKGAAKNNADVEIEQGTMMFDVAIAAKCEHIIFQSVARSGDFSDKVRHIVTKRVLETRLKEACSDSTPYTILQPTCFFENFNDSINWNPLKKGTLKFLSTAKVQWCATYDIGRAAAAVLANPAAWKGKSIPIVGWEGNVFDAAAALEKVSGVRTKGKLAMPICARSLFLNDLHLMCCHFENPDMKFVDSIDDFKKIVPDAFTPEDWFTDLGAYANGEKIVAA